MFFNLKFMALFSGMLITISLFASDAHLDCSGDIDILKTSLEKLKSKEPRPTSFSRKDSAELLVIDKENRILIKVYPWFGIDSKKILFPLNTHIKLGSDKYFEISILDEKKTVFCEMIYE